MINPGRKHLPDNVWEESQRFTKTEQKEPTEAIERLEEIVSAGSAIYVIVPVIATCLV